MAQTLLLRAHLAIVAIALSFASLQGCGTYPIAIDRDVQPPRPLLHGTPILVSWPRASDFASGLSHSPPRARCAALPSGVREWHWAQARDLHWFAAPAAPIEGSAPRSSRFGLALVRLRGGDAVRAFRSETGVKLGAEVGIVDCGGLFSLRSTDVPELYVGVESRAIGTESQELVVFGPPDLRPSGLLVFAPDDQPDVVTFRAERATIDALAQALPSATTPEALLPALERTLAAMSTNPSRAAALRRDVRMVLGGLPAAKKDMLSRAWVDRPTTDVVRLAAALHPFIPDLATELATAHIDSRKAAHLPFATAGAAIALHPYGGPYPFFLVRAVPGLVPPLAPVGAVAEAVFERDDFGGLPPDAESKRTGPPIAIEVSETQDVTQHMIKELREVRETTPAWDAWNARVEKIRASADWARTEHAAAVAELGNGVKRIHVNEITTPTDRYGNRQGADRVTNAYFDYVPMEPAEIAALQARMASARAVIDAVDAQVANMTKDAPTRSHAVERHVHVQAWKGGIQWRVSSPALPDGPIEVRFSADTIRHRDATKLDFHIQHADALREGREILKQEVLRQLHAGSVAFLRTRLDAHVATIAPARQVEELAWGCYWLGLDCSDHRWVPPRIRSKYDRGKPSRDP